MNSQLKGRSECPSLALRACLKIVVLPGISGRLMSE